MTVQEYRSNKEFQKRKKVGDKLEDKIVGTLTEFGIAARKSEDEHCYWDIELLNTSIRLEAKYRDTNFSQYSTQFMPVEKMQNLRNAEHYTTLVFTRNHDGIFYFNVKDLPDLSTLKVSYPSDGGAKTPSYHIPNKYFSKVHNTGHFIEIIQSYI